MNDMSYEEERAWGLYCKTTAGSMSARDFWHELPLSVQQVFLSRVRHARVDEVKTSHG